MIKILIGGSPCTHWSIAQKNGRETKPDGLGWELFKNYLIAKEKFEPDYFLYENNKSAAQPIKDQISRELGVDLMYINSALVSAQNRQRFYAFNWQVQQPEDRGILLRDILESGTNLSQNEKAYWLTASYSGACGWNTLERAQRTMVAEPIGTTKDGKAYCLSANYANGSGAKIGNYAAHTLTKGCKSMVAEPIRIGDIGSTSIKVGEVISGGIGSNKPVYEVKNGLITIKNKQYPVKLADGFYIIRKLTPVECERLQTMPDNYTASVSNAQRYKGLGNGWTAEVIIHILNGVLKDVPRDEEIVVLSMYDGIGTGRYCLDKMGFTNVKYFAYEIDKYAKQVAMSNYPDIIQCGDAFDLRHPDWTIGY